jgi:hypothetical protein
MGAARPRHTTFIDRERASAALAIRKKELVKPRRRRSMRVSDTSATDRSEYIESLIQPVYPSMPTRDSRPRSHNLMIRASRFLPTQKNCRILNKL